MKEIDTLAIYINEWKNWCRKNNVKWLDSETIDITSDRLERSKREDPSCCKRFYVEYDPAWGIPNGYQNIKPDGMRCSEHDSNVVREVQ